MKRDIQMGLAIISIVLLFMGPTSTLISYCDGISNDTIALILYPAEPFVENIGQWDDTILYISETGFGRVAITIDGLLYQTFEDDLTETLSLKDQDIMLPEGEVEFSIIKVNFEGASDFISIPTGKESALRNYLIGKDPSEWSIGAEEYNEILLPSVWDGVDILLRADEEGFKYDIHLTAPECLDNVKFHVQGHEGLELVDDGLRIKTPIGPDLIETGLRAYTEKGDIDIHASFNIIGNDHYSFILKDLPERGGIIIDPLVASTYLGGSDDDIFYDLSMDLNEDIYMAGHSYSSDIPVTSGAYQTAMQSSIDAVVVKMSNDLSSVLYCTYIGGSDIESIRNIDVDINGSAFITGISASTDYPTTPGAFDETSDGSTSTGDVFVTKLNPSGTALDYSTYLSGSSDDIGLHIHVSDIGLAYVAGGTASNDFPLKNPVQGTKGSTQDMIFFALTPDGSALYFSTYYGGSEDDIALGITLDGSSNVYVSGSTYSDDFPVTTGAYDTTYSGWTDVVVLKYDPVSNKTDYCTLVGGDDEEEGLDIEVDSLGNAYVAGYTWGGDTEVFPTTTNSYSTTYAGGSTDCFAFKLDQTGSNLIFSTYIGGSNEENFYRLKLDPDDNLLLGGVSDSSDYPTYSSAVSEDYNGGSNDGIVSLLSNDGTSLIYSSYIGGSNYDDVFGIASIDVGEFVVGGETGSTDIPTTMGAYSTSTNGGEDYYAMVININGPPAPPSNADVLVGETSLTISWDPPAYDGGSAITGYKIYRKVEEGSYPPEGISMTELTYTDTDVVKGTIYTYKVTAVNSFGEGAPTNDIITMLLSPPFPPDQFFAYPISDHVDLYWTEPMMNGGSEITQYRIYRGFASGDLQLLITITDLMDLIYSDYDIEPSTTYYYHVTAVNDVGESEPSDEISITTFGPPSPPLNVDVLEYDSRLDVGWDRPVDDGGSSIIQYNIYRGVNGSAPEFYVDRGAWSSYFIDTNVVNGGIYEYYLTASNIMGESQPSNIITGIPRGPPEAPVIVIGDVGDEFINLSWEIPFNNGMPILNFTIYSGGDEDCEDIVGVVDGEETSFNHSLLTNGQLYHYKMVAYNEAGASMISNILNATPLGVPEPPEGLLITIGLQNITLEWNLTWDDGGSPLMGYRLYRKEGANNFSLVNETNKTTHSDIDLDPDIEYRYVVTAFNKIGESPYSNNVSGSPYDIPQPPENMTIEPGDNMITLRWEAPVKTGGLNIKGFRIYKGISLYDMTIVEEKGPSEFSYQDYNVDVGITYHYSITSYHILGESERGEALTCMSIMPPSPPIDLKVTREGGKIVITWSPPLNDQISPILRYNIYRAPLNGDPELIGSVEGDTFTFTDHEPVKEAIYIYTVKAENVVGEGEGVISIEISVPKEASSSTGILILSILIALFLLMSIVIVVILIVRRSKKETSETVLAKGEGEVDKPLEANAPAEPALDTVLQPATPAYETGGPPVIGILDQVNQGEPLQSPQGQEIAPTPAGLPQQQMQPQSTVPQEQAPPELLADPAPQHPTDGTSTIQPLQPAPPSEPIEQPDAVQAPVEQKEPEIPPPTEGEADKITINEGLIDDLFQ